MQISRTVFKLRIYIGKKKKDIEKVFLSRNHGLIALPSIGIVACVVSCGLIAIGLIVGLITRCVRSRKKEEEANRVTNCRGNHAVQQDIGKTINQTKVDQELATLTTQNINNFRSIQNTQEVMNNLNSLNNGIKHGL